MTREKNPQDSERLLFQDYPTPTQSGFIRIISETGGLFTLQSVDGATFIFDLNTRQWISPPTTPGPSPSALVSPVPSVSPLPTQLP
jgi:hypothetical protein